MYVHTLSLADVVAYELDIVWRGVDFHVGGDGPTREARLDAAYTAAFNIMLACDLVDRLASAEIRFGACDISGLGLHISDLVNRLHDTHGICGYRTFYEWTMDQLGDQRRRDLAEDVVRFLLPFWPALGAAQLYGPETRGRNCASVVTELCRAFKMVHDLVSRHELP